MILFLPRHANGIILFEFVRISPIQGSIFYLMAYYNHNNPSGLNTNTWLAHFRKYIFKLFLL